jgi:hypothetical protein
LLDVVLLSPACGDVVKSVSRPIKSLLLTGWLFMCVLLIFTSLGMFLFGDLYSSDTDVNPCPDLLRCYMETAWMGITHPEEMAMDAVGYQDGARYYQRILFDLSFFVVIGVLLFNMVTGIIIDTFASCREETLEREEMLENTCFVTRCERAAGGVSPHFRQPLTHFVSPFSVRARPPAFPPARPPLA